MGRFFFGLLFYVSLVAVGLSIIRFRTTIIRLRQGQFGLFGARYARFMLIGDLIGLPLLAVAFCVGGLLGIVITISQAITGH
jgi:hypothetical protein